MLCLSCLYYRENDRKQGETPNAGNCVRLYFVDSFQSPLNKLCRLETKSIWLEIKRINENEIRLM